MTNQDLRSELQSLHQQIETAIHKESLDKDVLSHVMTDIVRISQGDDLQAAESETLKEQLEDQVADFEAGHPRLAATLRDIMDVLAKLGI
ncbi:MAG: DUF4404 family protein [Porticoccaceae bacterium]|nr:DUF4404 family protein [Porticoccaceae bacterium]